MGGGLPHPSTGETLPPTGESVGRLFMGTLRRGGCAPHRFCCPWRRRHHRRNGSSIMDRMPSFYSSFQTVSSAKGAVKEQSVSIPPLDNIRSRHRGATYTGTVERMPPQTGAWSSQPRSRRGGGPPRSTWGLEKKREPKMLVCWLGGHQADPGETIRTCCEHREMCGYKAGRGLERRRGSWMSWGVRCLLVTFSTEVAFSVFVFFWPPTP